MSLITEHLQKAFQWTWQTSAQASVFIAMALLLLFVWRRHLSPRWRMTLGLLILMRLVIPVLPESDFSYLNWIPATTDSVADSSSAIPGSGISAVSTKTSFTSPFQYSRSTFPSNAPTPPPDFLPVLVSNPVIVPVSNSINFIAAPAISAASSFTLPSLSSSLTAIWLLGISVLLLSTFYRRHLLFKEIKNQTRLCDDSLPTSILTRCRNELSIDRKIPLIPCHRIRTAAVLGYLRPVILISPQLEKNFTEDELRNILLHELVHIQRSDILWNWLAFSAQTLHWFNPLAWIASRLFRADRELACDARVLKHLSPEEHSHYGNTLIKIATLHSNNQFKLTPELASFNHRESEIKTRITMIANPNKINRLTHVILTLALAIVCSVTFTRAQDDEKSDKRKEVAERKRDSDRRPEAKKRDGDRDRPRPEHQKRGDHEQKGRPPRPPHPPVTKAPRDMPPEAREFADRVRALHQEIGQLHRQGNQEAAHDVENELKKFIQDHADMARRMGPEMHRPKGEPGRGRGPEHNSAGRRPHSPEADMEHVRGELHKAEKDGRREDVEKLRRHLEEMEQQHARRPGGPDEEAREMERRIHHLHQAAENLEQAGLGEAADKIHQQAEDMENEFHERRDQEERHHQERQIDHQERRLDAQEKQLDHQERQIDHQEKQIDHLTKENERLKAELRKKGKK